MQSPQGSLHYQFAHRVLPQFVQANPREIHTILSVSQRDNFIKDLWREIGVANRSQRSVQMPLNRCMHQ